MNEYCTRCDNTVSRARPCCSNCGVWLPWGDRAVVEARQARRRKYEEQERKEELALQVLRRAPEARVPAGESLMFRALRRWHLWQFSQTRRLAVCAALAAVVTASGTLWAINPGKGPQRPAQGQKREVLRAVCNDGTELQVNTRQGACSGHQGVLKFISEST